MLSACMHACTTRVRIDLNAVLYSVYSTVQQHREVGNLNHSSCNMPKPYLEDLRWRAVWVNVVCGMSSFEIADLLFVTIFDKKTAYGISALFAQCTFLVSQVKSVKVEFLSYLCQTIFLLCCLRRLTISYQGKISLSSLYSCCTRIPLL